MDKNLSIFGIFCLGWLLFAHGVSQASEDHFDRTVENGWGISDSGDKWSRSGGSKGDYAVDGELGSHHVSSAGASRNSLLGTDVLEPELRYRFRLDRLGTEASLYQYALLRARDSKTYYAARLDCRSDGRLKVGFEKRVLDTRTALGGAHESTRVHCSADTWLSVTAKVEGVNPSTLFIKVWQKGDPEPDSWDAMVTDAEQSLQVSGLVGLRSTTHSTVSNLPIVYEYDDVLIGSAIHSQSLYVDPVTGSDANSGTSGSPYRSLQKALEQVQAGGHIRLASGVYIEENETRRAGTADAPIVIEPIDSSATPILDGDGGTLNAIRMVHSYYILRDLEIRNSNEGVRLENVEGVVLENNEIHDVNNECMRLRYFARNNTLEGNTIYNCGLSGNGEGLYIGTAPEQRYKNGGAPDTSTGNRILGNTIFDCEEGIDIKEDSSHNVISENVVYGTTDANSAGINCRADDNTFENNRSYDNAGAGFRLGGDVVDDYHYGMNNLLRDNVADDNVFAGYKFMNGPQDADCTNLGSGNEGPLYYFDDEVEAFLNCE